MSAEPEYFAVPDPLDSWKMSYRYRPRAGRDAGKIQPWPPRRSRWGRPRIGDIPADKAAGPTSYRAYVGAHFARVREVWRTIEATVAADPDAAARFAAFTTRCCLCGKTLTDARSKTYGVGPECRAEMPAGLLAHFAEGIRKAHAAHLAATSDGAA